MAPRDPERRELWRDLRDRRTSARALLNLVGARTPPIDVFGIAKFLGVDVLPSYAPEWSGKVEIDDAPNEARILFSPHEARVRQRFTVAHELGHLMLHDSRSEAFRGDVTFSGSRDEVEANYFAADLLMPLDTLDDYVSSYGPNVRRLAAIFDVSTQAMEIRLGRLAGLR